MTDTPKMVSEVEAIRREHAAFENGARLCMAGLPWDWRGIEREANARYPLPNVTRPRIVRDDGGWEWRVHNTQLQYKSQHAHEWHDALNLCVETANRRSVLSDLLANPFEEVDPDAEETR